MPLPAGTHLGRYEVRSLLGKGGMGEVYLAHDSQLRRQVALKLLPAEFTENKVRLSRFEREAYAASSLNHPNILTIHEIGEHEGHHYMAAEYVEGESLRQHMSRTRMELREVLSVAAQVADALAAAHEAGIVHRDVKPENVMVRRDGYVKVLDFGLAKLADDAVAAARQESDPEAPTKTRVVNTEPGMVMGTASYMSPEQARGLQVDARSDIWSLGVVLYEMASGRLPFEGATNSDVIAMILHREPASLLLHRGGVPDELERIVEKALAKDREERYQLAKDLGVDLKRLRQRLEVEAELERSITPEEEVRRGSGALASGGRERAASGTTRAAAAAATAGSGAAHTVSSAEYVVGEIRRHKRGALLILAAVLAATVALAYFAYSRYSAGLGAGAITSVAVLPFANAGGDPGMEYLSDGISESLINALSRLPQLKVIARSSSFRYKGKEVDPQEVARALGVQAIVTGRVMQRGDGLQVSAELVDAREGTQLWGERYSRPAADVQAVQEEIARAVSERLRVRLTGAEERQLTKHATDNPRAYELYLNGVFSLRKGGIEDVKKGITYLTEATALDPGFAPAYAAIADSYSFLANNGAVDPREASARAKAAAQRALELDEKLAEAHVALGLLKQNEWDWSGAEAEFKRATELNPNLAVAHFRYAQYLPMMGRFEEALTEAKRAQELDPFRPNLKGHEGSILYFARRYDEAARRLQGVLELDPNNFVNHAYLGYTYEAQGKYAEAIGEHQKAAALVGENASVQCFLGYAYAMSGRRGDALAILDKLKATKEYVSPGELAILYVGLGDKEGAFQALERAYAARDLQLQYLNVDPHYDQLRSDPRFRDLVRRVGLPQ